MLSAAFYYGLAECLLTFLQLRIRDDFTIHVCHITFHVAGFTFHVLPPFFPGLSDPFFRNSLTKIGYLGLLQWLADRVIFTKSDP